MDKDHTLPDWQDLPEFEPPPELWSNILGAKLAQERRRFQIQGGIMLSITLAMAVALLRVVGQPAQVAAEPASALAANLVEVGQLSAVIEESRQLEAALRGLPQQGLPGWQRREIRLNRMRVGLIDKEIARAYEEGMDAGAIEELWRQRTENMRHILQTYDQAHLMTRI